LGVDAAELGQGIKLGVSQLRSDLLGVANINVNMIKGSLDLLQFLHSTFPGAGFENVVARICRLAQAMQARQHNGLTYGGQDSRSLQCLAIASSSPFNLCS
jgi:hypothetical protein